MTDNPSPLTQAWSVIEDALDLAADIDGSLEPALLEAKQTILAKLAESCPSVSMDGQIVAIGTEQEIAEWKAEFHDPADPDGMKHFTMLAP